VNRRGRRDDSSVNSSLSREPFPTPLSAPEDRPRPGVATGARTAHPLPWGLLSAAERDPEMIGKADHPMSAGVPEAPNPRGAAHLAWARWSERRPLRHGNSLVLKHGSTDVDT
jgi:hypothetical protein